MTAISHAEAVRGASAVLDPVQLVEFTRFLADEVRSGHYPFIEFDPHARWHQRIYRDPRVDVWLISWPSDQGTQLHDHGGSAGSFTVISGELAESVYVRSGRDAGLLREREHKAGRSVGFDPRYVHDVRNLSDAPAVSVHAYSAPLTSMTFYDVHEGELEKLATLVTDDPEPGVRPTRLR
jgi:predicted metal-dependent enzyme (double-stranded beta helix superfamily)